MSADLLEHCSAQEIEPSGLLAAIALRFRAIEDRFPSASKGLLSIFDQAIFSGTSFLTAALIGRATSPDQLGMYYLVLSIVLIISGVQEQLVAAPFVVYSKRRQGRDLAEYAGSMWAHYTIVTSIAMISILVAAAVLFATGQTKMLAGMWALLAAAPMILFRQWIRRFTFASLRLTSAIALDATVAVLQLSGLILLGHFGMLSLFRIYAVMGGACGLACLGWFFLDRPHLLFVRQRFLPDWCENWHFSKWALQTFVLGNTTPQLMLWIVSATIGASSTGIFGACNNLIGMAYVVLCGVDNVLTPQAAHAFATGGVKDLRRILIFAATFMAVTMGALCVFLLITGDWLVVLTFGNHYHGTGAIVLTLALSTTLNGLSIVVGNGLWAIHRPRSNFFADVCCMTVTLIAAALLIRPFGPLGAALASLAGASTAAVVRTFTLVRFLEDPALISNTEVSSDMSS
jgi:O-antigen/teichoic acid export membrane protein